MGYPMWTLILIVSLQSKFNHSLDIRSLATLNTKELCLKLGEKSASELRSYNSDVKVSIICSNPAHED